MQRVGWLQRRGSILHLYVGQHVTRVPAHCSLWRLRDASLRPRGRIVLPGTELQLKLQFIIGNGISVNETGARLFSPVIVGRSRRFRSHTSRKITRIWREIARLGPLSGKRRQLYSQPSVSVSASSHVRSVLKGPRLPFPRTRSPARGTQGPNSPFVWNSRRFGGMVPAAFSRAQPFRERAPGASRDRQQSSMLNIYSRRFQALTYYELLREGRRTGRKREILPCKLAHASGRYMPNRPPRGLHPRSHPLVVMRPVHYILWYTQVPREERTKLREADAFLTSEGRGKR